MNSEQEKAKKLAELLTAFSNGKQLQYQTENLEWFGTTSLMYVADSVIDNKRQIRIKPETKRVPLTKDDLVDRIKEGKTMWIKLIGSSTYQQIIAFGKEHFKVNCGTLYYGVLVDNYEFIDCTPCYKEVESE